MLSHLQKYSVKWYVNFMVCMWSITTCPYLMQREHSKSLGSSRSLATLLQVLALVSRCLESFTTPAVKGENALYNLLY